MVISKTFMESPKISTAVRTGTVVKTVVVVSLLAAGLAISAAGFAVMGKGAIQKKQVAKRAAPIQIPLTVCGMAPFLTDYIVTPAPATPNSFALPSQAIAAAQTGGDLNGNGTIEICVHGGSQAAGPIVYTEVSATSSTLIDMAPWAVSTGTGTEPVRIFSDTSAEYARWASNAAYVFEMLNSNPLTSQRLLTVTNIGFFGGRGAIAATSLEAKSLALVSDIFSGHQNNPAVWLSGGTTATIDSSKFIDNQSVAGSASLLLAGNAVVALTSDTFSKNRASEGPAINATDYASITDQRSVYQGNTATGNGGGAGGGAVFLNGYATYSGVNATFSDNISQASSTSSGEGGALLALGIGSVNCTGCTWTNNLGASSGGAITVYNLGGAIFVDNIFTGNRASGGGAIRMGDVMTVTLTGGKFESNSATAGDGGALYGLTQANAAGAVSVTGTTFLNNTATNVGGAIGLAGGQVSINQATFTGNTAPAGGAVFKSSYGNLTVDDSTFTDNKASAASGGGIWMGGAGGQPLVSYIFNSTFQRNLAGNEGGAIYGQDDAFITVNGGKFANNEAQNAGGAASVNGSDSSLFIQGVQFSQNKAVASFGRGGAVACYAGGPGMPLSILESEFTQNASTYHGGAVSSQGCEVALMDDSFASNTSQNAGAVSVSTTPAMFGYGMGITGSEFSGNSASAGAGGAIYAYLGTLNLDGVLLDGNTASQQGGGMYLLGTGRLTIANSTIQGNTAGDVGGGLVVFDRNIVLNDVEAINNTSSYNGGFLVASNGSFSGSHLNVRGNQVTNNGGGAGMYLYDVDANIVNSVLAGNDVPSAIIIAPSAIYYHSTGAAQLFLHYVTIAANTGGGVGAVSGITGPVSTDAVISAYNDVSQVREGATTTMYRTLLYASPPADPLQNAQTSFNAGIGNISDSPMFVGDASGSDPSASPNINAFDFHLQNASPAVDADNTGAVDADGSTADLGAYGGPNGAW